MSVDEKKLEDQQGPDPEAENNPPPPDHDEIDEPVKNPKRYTKTAIFSPEEFKYLDEICEARITALITRDWNHFLRQMTDFAVNGKHLGTAKFATPDIDPVFLKDAFCKPVK